MQGWQLVALDVSLHGTAILITFRSGLMKDSAVRFKSQSEEFM
jgi:hypothetical protein